MRAINTKLSDQRAREENSGLTMAFSLVGLLMVMRPMAPSSFPRIDPVAAALLPESSRRIETR